METQTGNLQANLREKWPPAGHSLGTIRVAGSDYPLVSVPTCRTCRSPRRLEIETAVISGAGFASTAREFGGESVSARSIKRHFQRGHLPLRAVAVRQYQESLAQQRGDAVAEIADDIAGLLKVASLVVGKVNAGVVSGEIQPTLSDALALAKLLLAADIEATSVDWDRIDSGLRAALEIVKDETEGDSFETVRNRLLSDPRTKQLFKRLDGTG